MGYRPTHRLTPVPDIVTIGRVRRSNRGSSGKRVATVAILDQARPSEFGYATVDGVARDAEKLRHLHLGESHATGLICLIEQEKCDLLRHRLLHEQEHPALAGG